MSMIDYLSSIFTTPAPTVTACNKQPVNTPAASDTVAQNRSEAPVTAPAPQPISAPPVAPPPVTNSLITWTPALAQEMNADDPANWQSASWSNGSVFNNTWQPDNISFRDGVMVLTLDNSGCPAGCDGLPYASGEYRTMEEIYGFGYYEARMKGAAGNGLVGGTFFVYRGTYGQQDHDEIDYEILGKDCSAIQTNYYVEGRGNHEEMIALGFNACEGFHNYGFKWAADALIFYIDGKEVRRVNEDPATPAHELPYRPGKIMANFWAGTNEVNGWLNGPFHYTSPLTVQYDWIRYSPLAAASQAPAEAPVQPAPVQPAIPANALSIESIKQGSFAFNSGNVTFGDGIWHFSAQQSKDPGFGILTGNAALEGRDHLVFEIKGSLQRLGNYARFIGQVYDDGNNDYTPAVSLDPIPLTGEFQTMTIDLRGKVDNVKKVQFLLVTDNGSCQVEVRNLRFE